MFVGRGRSFWGVESLKPVWWPNTVKFKCITKSNVSKDLIVTILHSYMVHNDIPIVIASPTPKIIKEVNNSAATSTPKRVRPSPSHFLTFTPIRKKQRVTGIDRDDIISVFDISADNSIFEGLTGEIILSKGNQVPPRPIDVKNTSRQQDEKLLTKAKDNNKNYIRCSTLNILRQSVKEICVCELNQAGQWLSDITIHAIV